MPKHACSRVVLGKSDLKLESPLAGRFEKALCQAPKTSPIGSVCQLENMPGNIFTEPGIAVIFYERAFRFTLLARPAWHVRPKLASASVFGAVEVGGFGVGGLGLGCADFFVGRASERTFPELRQHLRGDGKGQRMVDRTF